jgi:hypothetical protein
MEGHQSGDNGIVVPHPDDDGIMANAVPRRAFSLSRIMPLFRPYFGSFTLLSRFMDFCIVLIPWRSFK